jgi:hypothetical protein
VKGDLARPGGPTVSVSAFAAPGAFRLDPVSIRDDASDARLAAHGDNGALHIRYQGVLTADTLEKLVRLPDAGSFRIRGDLDLDMDRARPERSSARGTMEVQDWAIPWTPVRPLRIHALSLSGEGRKVRVNSSRLSWDNVLFSVTGAAEFVGDKVAVDADVSTGGVDVDRIARSLAGAARQPAGTGGKPRDEATGKGKSGAAPFAEFPIQGTVRVLAEAVTSRGFTWRPVRAEARLEDGILRLAIKDATLCGVSTSGSVTFGSGPPLTGLGLSASGQDVDKTTACLLEQRIAVSGTYDVSVRLEGRGGRDALAHSLHGPVELTVEDGRIRKMNALSKILALLNVTEMLRGKLPDMRKEGFAYRSFHLRGDVKGGKLSLEEAILDAPTMGIVATGNVDLLGKDTDLKILVAPFRTVDAVVRWIPGLSYVLGGTLVSIPVTVTGDIHDPEVKPMSPKAVGEGMLGIMTRTLKLPVKAIDAFTPGDPATQAP